MNEQNPTPGPGPDEAFEADVYALLCILRLFLRDPSRHQTELQEALENVAAWYEDDADPRANGWVDDKGRP
jgi:hypothetical protein